MTQAQVIAFIQTWIIANGNEEITADVLRPILEAMVNQPNDLIGDLGTLTTTATGDLVQAINEINANINGGLVVHSGTVNPNTTPPSSFNLGDFYLDTVASLFYQYDSNGWICLTKISGGTL